MRGIKNKESGKWKKIALFLILLLALLVLLNSVNRVYKKKKEVEKTLVRMKEQVIDLQNREKFLKESVGKLSTEDGLEFEIRKKLNVAGAGESVAIIVEENAATTTASHQISFWQKIKNFFGWLFE